MYGIHTIRAERGEQHTEKQLEVTETGGERVVTLGFGLAVGYTLVLFGNAQAEGDIESFG